MAEEHDETKLHFLDYWRVIRSRKEVILGVMLLVTVSGIVYTINLPKVYMASTQIEVHEDVPDEPVFQPDYVPAYNPFFLKTEFEKIQANPVLHEVVKQLHLDVKWGEKLNKGVPLTLEDASGLLARSIRVGQVRDTTLIEIDAYSEDKTEARDIANCIASVYADQRKSVEQDRQKKSGDVFQEELQKYKDDVSNADARVAQIIKDNHINILGADSANNTLSSQYLMELQANCGAAKVDMVTRRARWEEIANVSGDDLIYKSSFLVNDASLQALRKELTDDEVLLQTLLQTYGEKHPDVVQLKAAVAELKDKLSKSIEGVKQGLKADYDVAEAKYEEIEKELNAAKAANTGVEKDKLMLLEQAQKDADTKRQQLVWLEAKETEQKFQARAPRTPVETVERAEIPDRPVSPNIMLNVFLSVVLGLGAGVGLAYFIEYLDTSVKTVDDVEKFLGLPVLGVIPQKVRPLSEQGPESPHAEAYRVLRTNMQFANKGRHGGAFSVVSGGVGEGKSTTLFNLAYVCAQLGDKVLVVDSDLRRPVQHTFFGMSNRFGLTNVLMRDLPVEESIKATSIPNLHFLPSGKLPRSSLGLLDSQRMHELVKNLKARYDYVLFDSPPIIGVSDASILASEVDAVLLVVQYRKYPRNISLRAKRMLENVGTNIVGVVLNNINVLRDDYYYYYHSYYSHYDRSEDAKPADDAAGDGAGDGKKEAF